MSTSINTNIAAFYAQANIATASQLAQSSVARLSSGNRIVQASDDVTALAIGTSLGSQISSLKTAQTNASQGSSLLQVADGALAQIQSILQQMQSISNQAQSGTLTDTDRGFLNQQFQALSSEIDTLASSTTFNGVQLIDGSISGANPLQSTTTGTSGSATDAAIVSGFTAQVDFTQPTHTFYNDHNTSNDTTFYGDLSKGTFDVVSDGATGFLVSYNLNGSTYAGDLTKAITTAGGTLTLDNGQGTIALTVPGAMTSPTATSVKTELTAAFASATAYASHLVLSTDAKSGGKPIVGSAIQATSTDGTANLQGSLLSGWSGANVSIQSAQFDGVHLPSISNFTAVGSGVGMILSFVLNGQTYSTGKATTNAAGISTAVFTGGAATGKPTFYLNGDTTSKEKVTLDLTTGGGHLTADNTSLTTVGGVANFTAALNAAFGAGSGGGSSLNFQLGSTSTSIVNVSIGSAKATSLFGGVALDVSTAPDAATAATAVGTALDTVTALRSGVGSLETQFNYASAALQVGVQNQTAAQSGLLDTDITTESTAFATEQVKLQAGISVLAQANQQLQALLKLIG